MGCGESKHAVATATGNTVSVLKKPNDHTKRSKDIETINETGATTEAPAQLVQQVESEKAIEDSPGEDNKLGEVADVKEIIPDAELKKEGEIEESKVEEKEKEKEKEKGDVVEEKEPEERLIARESPNHFFSSRKDEESIDGISSEPSEKSEYFSPSHASKESEKPENAIEEKALVEETKTEIDNEEPEQKNEENVVEEAEVKKSTEAKDPSADDQEHSIDAPAEDQKTN